MQKPDNFEVRINIFAKNVRLLLSPIEELAVGIRANTVPWDICAGWTFFAMIVIVFKID